MIKSKKKIECITHNIDGVNKISQPALRYLGVMIDVRLNFRINIQKACETANSEQKTVVGKGYSVYNDVCGTCVRSGVGIRT